MGAPDGRERMLKRHEIVVRIIEANSERLRLENEINGLDIQRRAAERALGKIAPAPIPQKILDAVDALADRKKLLDDKRTKLDVERQWLDETLADFDSSSAWRG